MNLTVEEMNLSENDKEFLKKSFANKSSKSYDV